MLFNLKTLLNIITNKLLMSQTSCENERQVALIVFLKKSKKPLIYYILALC